MPASVTVKFAVDGAGRPGPLEVLSTGVDLPAQRAIAEAVQSCRWSAGLDPQSRPASLWTILPIRLVRR